MSGYLRPVDPINGRMSTFIAHTRRTPPSKEPGVDYYCPIGTPVRSLESGVVAEVGGSVLPASGRYVKVNLDDGRSFRVLHLKEWRVRIGQRVSRGQILGLSGASGYGSEFFGADSLARIPANTGGPHVHATLFPTHAKTYSNTLDLEKYIGGGSSAGGGSTPFDPTQETPDSEEEEAMYSIYRAGGDIIIVGNGSVLELGPGLTNKTGVDGAETLAAFVAGGAKVYDLDRRQFDVVRVNVLAGTPAPQPIPSAPSFPSAAEIADRVWDEEIMVGEGGTLPARTQLSNVNAQVYGLWTRATAGNAGPELDEAEFAAALAPLILGSMRTLDAETVTAIAKASADEEDRRDRERLGA